MSQDDDISLFQEFICWKNKLKKRAKSVELERVSVSGSETVEARSTPGDADTIICESHTTDQQAAKSDEDTIGPNQQAAKSDDDNHSVCESFTAAEYLATSKGKGKKSTIPSRNFHVS